MPRGLRSGWDSVCYVKCFCGRCGGDKDKKDLCPSDAYSICFPLLRENVISKDLRYYMSANIQIQ